MNENSCVKYTEYMARCGRGESLQNDLVPRMLYHTKGQLLAIQPTRVKFKKFPWRCFDNYT